MYLKHDSTLLFQHSSTSFRKKELLIGGRLSPRGQQRRPLICEVFKVDGVDGVAVLLDLDNFPLHNQMSGLLTAIRLQVDMQSLVEAKAGPISVFTAYCNTDTSKKTSAMRSALELAGIRIMAVDVRRNAADRLMKSHAMDLSHRCKSIAIVSADTGFAETVQHCRSMDCQVIVIGVIGKWEELQSWRWSKAKLAAAADIAMRWSNAHLSFASPGELELLTVLKKEAIKEKSDGRTLVAIERILNGQSCAGTVVDTWCRSDQ